MPALQHRLQPLAHGLLADRLAALGLGGAHQLLQGLLAQLDLLLEQGQILLQRRLVTVLLAQLLEQHAHGRQWRAQLVGGAGGLGGYGEQLLVAHALLATLGAQLLLPAQPLGHLGDEEGDHHRCQGEAQPHAVDHQALARTGGDLQRVRPEQQQGVADQRQAGQGQGMQPGQGRRGDGQRHQVVGDEGIARTAGVVQQHAVDHQIAAQLHRILQFGDRPGDAQAQGSEDTEQRRNTEGDAQLGPRQLKLAGQPGKTDRASLGGQHEQTDQHQPAEVLQTGGK
ncbi:hypothetical protein D3C78_733710 [compost metagenome]